PDRVARGFSPEEEAQVASWHDGRRRVGELAKAGDRDRDLPRFRGDRARASGHGGERVPWCREIVERPCSSQLQAQELEAGALATLAGPRQPRRLLQTGPGRRAVDAREAERVLVQPAGPELRRELR